MNTINVSLVQTNNKGEATFNASMKINENANAPALIAEFCKKYYNLCERKTALGVKGLNKLRIKSSQPLKLYIAFDDDIFVFSYNSFGRLISEATQEQLSEIFTLDYEFKQSLPFATIG